MKQEHIDFLEKNKINFETVKLGFTKNIAIQDLQMYEHIYHLYINPNYVLTYWCGDCVFDMLKRLMNYYENLPAAQPETLTATVQVSEEVYQLAVESSKPVFESKDIPKPKAKRSKK